MSRSDKAILICGFVVALVAAVVTGETIVAPVALALAFYPVALAPAALTQQEVQMTITARQRTWASARQPGPTMEFYLAPTETSLFGLPPGTYTNATPLSPLNRVFGKPTIIICNAWQQSESWLIDGRFIPACPPHDGPPDRVVNTRR